MKPAASIYDSHFDAGERKRIRFLRQLDRRRKELAWTIGILSVVGVFLTQIPFDGPSVVHVLASYGCIPIGLAAGVGFYWWADILIETEFKNKWDPLYFKRSGTTPKHWMHIDAINALIENYNFVAKPLDEQKRIMDALNRRFEDMNDDGTWRHRS